MKFLILVLIITNIYAEKVFYNDNFIFDTNTTSKNDTIYFTDRKTGEFCFCKNIKDKWVCKEMEDY